MTRITNGMDYHGMNLQAVLRLILRVCRSIERSFISLFPYVSCFLLPTLFHLSFPVSLSGNDFILSGEPKKKEYLSRINIHGGQLGDELGYQSCSACLSGGLFNLRLPHVRLFFLLVMYFLPMLYLCSAFLPVVSFLPLHFLLNPLHPTIFLAIFFVSVSLFVV
ncbi:hypothetical protein VTN00DRAFT_2070 [Thermoascus crustaceus]|uniref:uncharacterized protein n=1 Tax=Thermoascus crustaceus TaxID=5088 RepID=UPI0037445D1C